MNWVDIILILLLIGGTILGIISGFFWQFSRFIILIIAAYLTILLHEPIANWLTSKMSDPSLAKTIIFVFIFVCIYLILYFATWFIERAIVRPPIKPLNKIFGGIFGFLRTALICGTILVGLIYYSAPNIRQTLSHSFLSPYLLIYTRKTICWMPKRYKQEIKRFISRVYPEFDKKTRK